MYKKRNIIFSILIIVLSIFITSSTSLIKADDTSTANTTKDWGSQFVDSIQILDEDGNPKTTYGINDAMQVKWHFNIPAGTSIKEGDTMTVDMPEQLTFVDDVKFDIVDDNSPTKDVVAHAIASKTTHQVQMTFTDYAEKNAANGMSGSLYTAVKWDINQVTSGTKVPLKWNVSGSVAGSNVGDSTVSIDPSDGPDPNETIYKWGAYGDTVDGTNNKIIHWSVRVNYKGNDTDNPINDAVYTDTLGANHALVLGSVKVYNVKFGPNDYNDPSNKTLDESAKVTENGTGGYAVKFGDIKNAYLIQYDTQETDQGVSTSYENRGTLTGNKNQTIGTVDVTSPNNTAGGSASTNNTTVTGTKTWKDNNNAENTRPNSITVNLISNDDGKVSVAESKQVTAADNWQYSFDNLPQKDASGKDIIYSISEDQVPNYTTAINGFNITNTYVHKTTNVVPSTKSLTVKKVWNDSDNQDKIRPNSIKVQLVSNSGVVSDPVVLNDQNNWSYTFNGLNKQTDYSIKEDKVEGYTAKITKVDANNIVVTNTHTPKSKVDQKNKDLTVTKIWNDNNNQDGIRPDKVSVQLQADGKNYGAAITLSSQNNWSVTFKNLNKDKDYTVKEIPVSGYTSTSKEIDANNIVITNTHEPNSKQNTDHNPIIPTNGGDSNDENTLLPNDSIAQDTVDHGKNDSGKLPQTGNKIINLSYGLFGLITIVSVMIYRTRRRSN